DEQKRQGDLFGDLHRVDVQIAALSRSKLSKEEQAKKLNELVGQQLSGQAELSQFENDMRRRYGVIRGEVYDLARIQKQLPHDSALIAWLDISGESKAAAPSGEHWACVVRHQGEPAWAKLPGSGANQAWTQADDDLLDHFRRSLARETKTARDIKPEAQSIPD